MMKTAKMSSLLLAGVLLAGSLHADNAANAAPKNTAEKPATKVNSPTSANAAALSKAMLPETQFSQMVDAIVQTGIGAARQKVENEKLTIDMDKKGKELEKSLRAAFTYDYFIGLNSKSMMKNFSDEELGKILAFYNTSVGKKWTKFTPDIISDTMMAVQMDLQEKLPKFVDAMIAK